MSTYIPAQMLLDRPVLENPYPFYRRLQNEAPVWQVPETHIFVVTRFALLDEASRRIDDFSSNLTSVLYRKRNGVPGRLTRRNSDLQILATADPPSHARHKAAVLPHFSAKQMARLSAEVERVTDACISNALRGETTDFMAEVGNPLPIQIVSDMVGFKGGDLNKLLQAAFDSTAVVSGSSSLVELGRCMLRSYLTYRWVGKQLRAASTTEQNILGSVKRGIENGSLEEVEGCAFLQLFLAAGGESTTSLLGSAVRMLAEDQSLQQTLREQPQLVSAYIEEVLRLESPFRFHLRSTPAATSLGGVSIPAGATVLLFWGAGNRDPEVYRNPDEVDLARPRKHLAFGRGIHTCIGAPLARLEAETVLKVLLDRTIKIAPVPSSPPEWVTSLQVRRYAKLPLQVA